MLKLRKTLVAAASVLVALSLLGGAAGAEDLDPVGLENDFVARVNDLRASQGLGTLSVDPSLTAVARDWAAQMAGAREISHRPNLTAVAPSTWMVLGENVGSGPAVDPIQDALVASPTHYRNLVDGRFQQVGVGVVVVDGTIYMAQNFMTSAPQAAAAKACKAKKCRAAKRAPARKAKARRAAPRR